MWDDEIEVSDDSTPAILNGPAHQHPQSPRASVSTIPSPVETRARRSQSVTDFPPPMRRVSTDFTGAPRPVSFSAKFSRVHPATTGVTVLEHMERLDAVEAGLKRLGVDEEAAEEEETDVGTVRTKSAKRQQSLDSSVELVMSPSERSERLPPVQEDEGADGDAASITEEDLVAMSKSMPQLESPIPIAGRWTSTDERSNLDWMDVDGGSNAKKRLVIAEVSTPSLM